MVKDLDSESQYILRNLSVNYYNEVNKRTYIITR